MNLMEMWGHMGLLDKLIVVLLAGMSMYSIWVMIDRFLAMRKAKTNSDEFLQRLSGRLEKGDIEGALDDAKHQDASPVARVVEAMIEEYGLNQESLFASKAASEEVDIDVIDAIMREIARVREAEVSGLKRGLAGLASISAAGPFIGLLGTVIGIINAFASMGASGQGGLASVSAGISEALFTTATGLVVAIPALMAFNYFIHRVDEFVLGMNDTSSQVLNYLVRSVKAQKRAA